MTERLKLHGVTLSNLPRNINKELSLKTAALNITFVTFYWNFIPSLHAMQLHRND